jgi:hypothetical protein
VLVLDIIGGGGRVLLMFSIEVVEVGDKITKKTAERCTHTMRVNVLHKNSSTGINQTLLDEEPIYSCQLKMFCP